MVSGIWLDKIVMCGGFAHIHMVLTPNEIATGMISCAEIKTFVWSQSHDFGGNYHTATHGQQTGRVRAWQNCSIVTMIHTDSYIDMLIPTKIPFCYYDNTPVNCKSTHPKTTFIVMAKVSLPSFCLLIFLWNHLNQISHLHLHTQSVSSQTFHSHVHIHSNFFSRTLMNFWTCGF